ncbi:MAG: biopolymer transporter ExbD [Alphaproteobacteria bacterium]
MHFASPRPRKDEERILPLINIVFLLLIFFMLAGRLAASDPFNVAPAQSASEATAESPEMLVLVGADGQLALDGKILDDAALGADVAARLGGAGDANPRIRLKADGGAPAVRVVAVMELLREAGVETLSLLTTPKVP